MEEKRHPVAGVWGTKIGMTQIFSGEKVVPVTAINVGSWVVTRIKTAERDGYNALQIGCVKKRYQGQDFSADWVKKPKQYFSFIREVKIADGIETYTVGQVVEATSLLTTDDFVDVFGRTKGCGFAGVVRRYNFGGPPASHGSTMGNKPGSLSFMTSCGRVIKGKKMPGHMGDKNRVMKNLKVVKIEPEENIVLVKGSVPGKPGSLVFLRKV